MQLSFHRFVSYKNVHVIGAYVEIKPVNCDVKATVVSGINAQVTNHGAQHLTEFSSVHLKKNFFKWVWSRQNRQFQLQSAPYIKYSRAESIQKMRHLRSLMTEEKSTLKFSLSFHRRDCKSGEDFNGPFQQRSGVCGIRKEPEGENVCRDGLDNLKEAEEKGYETLLEESKKSGRKSGRNRIFRLIVKKMMHR